MVKICSLLRNDRFLSSSRPARVDYGKKDGKRMEETKQKKEGVSSYFDTPSSSLRSLKDLNLGPPD